jgi:uncharacterized protein (TIGR02466 family)
MRINEDLKLERASTPPVDVLVSDLLFPTVVWRKELSYNSSNLKDYVINLKDSQSGRVLSNYGGWQSYEIVDGVPNEFKELETILNDTANQICLEANLPSIRLNNVWFNVNVPGSYNSIHNHQNSILSGVYYIDVPEENMGDIEFFRSDDSQYYLRNNEQTFFGTERVTYKAQTGILLMFPGWLKHSVQSNMSKQNRISMSFNYVWS